MKFKVVVFPGSNCDHDCYHVIKHVMGHEAEFLWHKDSHVGECDCLVLPGGFSYGDYLRSGAIAKFSPIMKDVIRFANDGGMVLGICNGFQVLLESKLLPGALRRNASMHFMCKDVFLRVENAGTPFSCHYSSGEVIRVPIAHMDGNYYVDDKTLEQMKQNKQIVFRYSDKEGKLDKNPNGSIESIAGICSENGNVLGLMPHPERCAEKILGNSDGYGMFQSAVSWMEKNGGASH